VCRALALSTFILSVFSVPLCKSITSKHLQSLYSLFALSKKVNPFAIKQIQPLFAKHPGWGVPVRMSRSGRIAASAACPVLNSTQWSLANLLDYEILLTRPYLKGNALPIFPQRSVRFPWSIM